MNLALYTANKGLDRDKDGIAGEKALTGGGSRVAEWRVATLSDGAAADG